MNITPIRTEFDGVVAVMTDEVSKEELRWSMRFVEKTSAGGRRLGDDNDDDFVPVIERLFDELNQFIIQKLSFEERARLFQIYKDIQPVVSPQTRTLLQEKLVELYKILDLNKIYDWVINYSEIKASKTIKKLYVQNLTGESRDHSRDRTYIEVDYLWLVALAIALRGMLPIWGEWFKFPDQSNNLKERQAFTLLNRTSLMTAGPNPDDPRTLDIYPPMQKLEMFVAGSIPPVKDIKHSAIVVGGLTTEELPDWMLALTIVRRVSVGELRNDFANQKRNVCLVASIYKFVDNRIKQLDKNFGGRITEKEITEAASEENNLSRMESFREHDRTPADAIEKTRTFLMYPESVIRSLSEMASINPGYYDSALYQEILQICTQTFAQREIEEVQEQILKWMAATFMSPRMLDHMDYQQYINLMAGVVAFLIEHNHIEVAAILCGVPMADTGSMMIGAPSSSNRLETGLSQRLRALYKYSRPYMVKRNSSNDNRLAIDDCLNEASNKIKEHVWIVTLPERFCTPQMENRRFIPFDTKTILAKLAICIAERNF